MIDPYAKQTLDEEEQKSLRSMLLALQPFLELRKDMPLQYFVSFLMVAVNEGLSLTEYAERAGVSQSVMLRHIFDIGEGDRTMKEGFGLVFRKQDPVDLRTWRVFLTDKGRAVARRMQQAWSKSGAGELKPQDEVSDKRSEDQMTDEDKTNRFMMWDERLTAIGEAVVRAKQQVEWDLRFASVAQRFLDEVAVPAAEQAWINHGGRIDREDWVDAELTDDEWVEATLAHISHEEDGHRSGKVVQDILATLPIEWLEAELERREKAED
jgi:DNA-binding MarR family transcriptional regulator